MSVIDPGTVVITLTRLIDVASRRAEHHAVLTTVVANCATNDVDGGNASIFGPKPFDPDYFVSSVSRNVLFIIFEISH